MIGPSRSLDVAPHAGADLRVTVDGALLAARAGESVMDLLGAHGQVATGTGRDGRPVGPSCGMGVCFSCVLSVDGVRSRACTTPVAEAMVVTTGTLLALPAQQGPQPGRAAS